MKEFKWLLHMDRYFESIRWAIKN